MNKCPIKHMLPCHHSRWQIPQARIAVVSPKSQEPHGGHVSGTRPVTNCGEENLQLLIKLTEYLHNTLV